MSDSVLYPLGVLIWWVRAISISRRIASERDGSSFGLASVLRRSCAGDLERFRDF
jgi:hypothetical protein